MTRTLAPRTLAAAPNDRLRVVIYARISPTGSGERGTTNQVNACMPLAESLGVVTEQYVDIDSSATSGAPRREYLRMLADLKAGAFDVIVAWHTDRLYRRPTELEELVSIVEAHHVMIRTVQAGELDLSTPSGRMIARLFGAYNRYEVEIKVERQHLSITANRTAGKWSGSKFRLFGFERDGTHREDEAEVGRWIGGKALARKSLAWIGREVTLGGWRTTSGGVWGVRSVGDWLRNPKVAGFATLNGGIVGAGQWDPIIPPDDWHRIQAVLHPGRAPITRVALLGPTKIFCACDTGMRTATRQKSRVGPNGHARVYRCPTVEPYAVGCGKVTIVAEPVEWIVEGYARTKFEDPQFADAVARRVVKGSQQAQRVLSELAELESKLALLQTQLLGATSRTAAAVITAIADTERKVNEKTGQLSALPSSGYHYTGTWPTSLEGRSTLVGLAVERVVIHPVIRRGPKFDPERIQVYPVAA